MKSYKFQIGDKVIYHSSLPSYYSQWDGLKGIIIRQARFSEFIVEWDNGSERKYRVVAHRLFLNKNGLDKLNEIL